MHIPFLTEVQNGRVNPWKNGQTLIKNVFFKLNFQDEGQLAANFLMLILSIYQKCLFFQFSSRGIRMHILILSHCKFQILWVTNSLNETLITHYEKKKTETTVNVSYFKNIMSHWEYT